MQLSRLAVGLLALASLLAAPAHAGDEALTLRLPRDGLTITVPAGWTFAQYGDALLELRRGDATLWVRAYDGPATREAARAWTEHGEAGARCLALIAHEGKAVFEVEAVLPEVTDALRGEVEAVLDSIDAAPYRHASRHVDWHAGWTLDLPSGWARRPSPRPVASFASEDDASWLVVEDLETLLAAQSGEVEDELDLEAWTAFAWKGALARLQDEHGWAPHGEPAITDVELEGARRAKHVVHGLDPDEEGRPGAMAHVLVAPPHRVLLVTRPASGEAAARGKEALLTFRLGTHPGPRAATSVPGATPLQRLPGDGGPPVGFRLPEGWRLQPSTMRMRLAEIRFGSVESTLVAIYWFGAGGGGGVEDNLRRWRGQMQPQEQAETAKLEVAEGVTAHLLDVSGSYFPGMGSGMPHGRGHEGFRMLAGVLEVPDGPLFVKLVGPADVVAAQAEAFRAWIQSFRVVK